MASRTGHDKLDFGMVGLVIDGKYRVVRQLGEGGMGVVYEAVHDGTRRRVALKVILNANLAANSDMIVRFQREARAAGAIDTQHIVQVFDTGCDPITKHPFMVMEYLAGEDLSNVVKRVGPLPPEVALRIVAQAAMGLHKAHEAGVIHRDIKPANLYLARREAGEVIVKVLDFGIAKITMDQITSVENAALTRTGNMLGSPLYMSPEQAKGLRSINHQTDIWSLGVVLHEALCGHTPNAGVESLGQLILAICGDPPTPIQDLAPWVPPEVASIVHRALQIDTARRFASMTEMLDAIRALLPNGWAIQDQHLTQLPPQMRAYVAPRLAVSQGAPATGQNQNQNQNQNVPGVPGSDPGSNRTVITGNIGNTGNTGPHLQRQGSAMDMAAGAHAISQSGVTGPSSLTPRSSSRAPLVIGGSILVATIVAAGGVFGARAYNKHLRAQEAPTVVVSAASSLASVTSSAPSSASSAAPATSSEVAPVPRVSKLVIEPPNAVVEIDGVKVDVVDGAVAIAGPPGTMHKVHVSLGKKELRAEVFVIEKGVHPEKMQLAGIETPTVVAATSARTTAPKSSASATAPAGSHGGIERKTDEFK